jgi:hypothetical protein
MINVRKLGVRIVWLEKVLAFREKRALSLATPTHYNKNIQMKKNNILKPIKIFSGILIIASFIGIFKFFSFLVDPEFDSSFKVFIIGMFIFHFITGIGLLTQKIWGFYLFKLFLFIFLLGVPIGTLISWKTLQYIKKHDLEKFFT